MSQATDPTYTESLESLEKILDQYKQGNLPLEKSLELFEEGVGHLKNCQSHLTQAREKVETLVKTLGEDGEIVTKPLG